MRVLTLAECAEVLPGFSIAGRQERDPDGTHQVLTTRHLTEGESYRYDPRHGNRILPGRDTSRYEVHSGDVVFMSRGTRNLAWVIADVFDPTIVSVSFYILRPVDGVEGRYLAWYLNQAPVQAAIDQIRTGAGTPIVQREAFRMIEVLLPDLETQQQVADLSELQARERALRARLVDVTERMQTVIGRQIIEGLRRTASQREPS